MLKCSHLIPAFLGLLLLTQCNSEQHSDIVVRDVMPPATTLPANLLTGTWKYGTNIWNSSVLTLHNDGTFAFNERSCLGQQSSRGKWVYNRGTLLLTSFDNFKQEEQPVTGAHNDTALVYFDKIQLQLINDTLYCVNSNNFLEQAKFFRDGHATTYTSSLYPFP